MAQNIFEPQKNEVRMVLIGKSGSGKSRTGNVILGIESGNPGRFEFSCNAQSETKVCELKTANRFGLKLDVVDTPGVFDTQKDNTETQLEIKRCLLQTFPGPHAILLCVPMGRFTVEDVNTVDHFVGYFGPELFEYVVVVFTHFDEWKEDQIDLGIDDPKPETYIKNLHVKLSKFLLEGYNNYCFFDNNLDISEDSQIKHLLQIIERNINRNNGKCFTNDTYKTIEVMLKKIKGRHTLLDDIKYACLKCMDFWIDIAITIHHTIFTSILDYKFRKDGDSNV